MNIHFIQHLPNYAWGGSEVLWSALAQRMLEGGHQVSAQVGILSKPVESVARLRAAGARIRYHSRLSDRPAIARKLTSTRARRLRRCHADVLFINLALHGLGLEQLEAVQRSGKPYVILIQSVNAPAWSPDPLAARFRDIYLGAKSIFFVSQGNLEAVQDMLARDLPNASVVCNVPHAPELQPLPWPSRIGSEELAFALVGRIEPIAKGHDILLETLANEKWRSRDVVINLYGKGASAVTFQQAVKRAGLEDKFVFHGHVSDMDSVWGANHALLLPSRYEGSPLVLVEAMLYGRPVVTTAVAGCAEWIREGDNGFLAESPCAPALDRAMEACWQARSKLETMGHSARKFAMSRLPDDPLDDLIERIETTL